jgi:glycosyltransferase involved in cell wall biosynthesis
VSEFEKKLIRERLEVPEEKVKVVYNGVHERFFHPYSDEELYNFRTRFKLPLNFMLFLGNQAPKKNTINVIRAFARYCEAEKHPLPLVVLDYDPPQMLQLLKRYGIDSCMDKIFFPGFINHEEMPLIYQCADIFLYPSLRESFGMPILESMAGGTPVITSNTSSMPEVGGDAAFYVDPFSVEDILRGILRMVSDAHLRRELIKSGKERARQFTWHRAATQVLEYYNSFSK